jgi:hypothetical protein
MLRLLLSDGSLREIQEAVSAERLATQLILRDADGVEVARFRKVEVAVIGVSAGAAKAYSEGVKSRRLPKT